MRDEASQWKELVCWEAKKQWKGEPIQGPVKIQFEIFFKDKRRRDISNTLKLMEDALEEIVYIDDKQIYFETIIRNFSSSNPRIEISIEPFYDSSSEN